MENTFKIFTDGGSRGNPGPSGAGGVIMKNDVIIAEISEFLNFQTNNYAEYTALLLTLKRAVELGIKNVEVFMDSKLIVEQMNGNYKVKNANLKIKFDEIKLLKFDNITYNFIYRKFNKIADKLANKAMDNGLKKN